MTDSNEPGPVGPASPVDPAAFERDIDSSSAADALRLLAGEVRAAASSEMELARACGAIVGTSVKAISIWGVVALITVFIALLALAIGLMIALADVTGPLLAALIVPAVLLCVTAFAGLRIRSAANRAKAAVARLSA